MLARMPADTRSRAATSALVVVAWGVIVAAVLGVGWLLTSSAGAPVDAWDDDVARSIAEQRSPGLGRVADAGTFLGETLVGASIAALAGLAVASRLRSWLPLLFVVLLEVGIGGIYWVTTHVITRDRPPVKILDPGLVLDHSFPSGHVATAVAAYGGLAVLLAVLAPATRRWVWVLLLLPALVVAARLYEGAHHVTDVATSVVYTTVWLAVLAPAVLGGRAERDRT
jgi:undecaprenyl-diphosphatase